MQRLKIHFCIAFTLLILWLIYFFIIFPLPAENALLDAARKGDDTMVQSLLHKGTYIETVDGWNTTPLYYAAGNCNTSTVKILLARGARINKESRMDRTALMIAAQGGCYEVVQTLLDKGAVIDKRDMEGDTAITLAAKKGHTDILELFKKHKPNPNIKS